MASKMTIIATAVLLLVYASLATLGSTRPGVDSLFNSGRAVATYGSGRAEGSAKAVQHVFAADCDSLDRERGVALTSIPDGVAELDSDSTPTAPPEYFQVVRRFLGETSSNGSTKGSKNGKSKGKKKKKGCKCNGDSPSPAPAPTNGTNVTTGGTGDTVDGGEPGDEGGDYAEESVSRFVSSDRATSPSAPGPSYTSSNTCKCTSSNSYDDEESDDDDGDGDNAD